MHYSSGTDSMDERNVSDDSIVSQDLPNTLVDFSLREAFYHVKKKLMPQLDEDKQID